MTGVMRKKCYLGVRGNVPDWVAVVEKVCQLTENACLLMSKKFMGQSKISREFVHSGILIF